MRRQQSGWGGRAGASGEKDIDDMQRNLQIRGGLLAVLGIAGAFLAGASSAGAQPQPATVQVSSMDSLPGGVPEVSVSLNTPGPSPVSMVLFFAYPAASLALDDDYFETVLRNTQGVIIRDEDGNAETRRGAVMPSVGVVGAGKSLEVQVYAGGVLGVVISGLNQTPIPDGELFRIGFQVASGAAANARLALAGVTAENSVSVQNPNTGQPEPVFSSASYMDGAIEQSLPLIFFNGEVLLSCGGRAAAPANVRASKGDPDSVTVEWGLTEPGASYRVYRADSADLSAALPLGDEWTTGQDSFTDFSAIAAVQTQTRGCFPMTIDEETAHFYWVLARDADGCESAYAGPVEGFRGGETKAAGGTLAAGHTGDMLTFALALGLLPLFLRRKAATR